MLLIEVQGDYSLKVGKSSEAALDAASEAGSGGLGGFRVAFGWRLRVSRLWGCRFWACLWGLGPPSGWNQDIGFREGVVFAMQIPKCRDSYKHVSQLSKCLGGRLSRERVVQKAYSFLTIFPVGFRRMIQGRFVSHTPSVTTGTPPQTPLGSSASPGCGWLEEFPTKNNDPVSTVIYFGKRARQGYVYVYIIYIYIHRYICICV